MDTQTIHPENFPERIVWHAITWTYVYYALGALYVLAPVIGWVLFIYLLAKLYTQHPQNSEKITIPPAVMLWALAMIMMQVVLLIAHYQWNLSLGQTIKSSVGWAKGWALLAIFPLIGCLPIRPKLIFRATAIVCKHTLILIPLVLLAPKIGLPKDIYTSPLKIIGGPGPEFFTLSLYGQGPDGTLRWRLFTPWGPALGMIGIFYFIFALQEKGKWFWYGILGSLFMILASKSRLALIAVIFIPTFSYFITQLYRPYLYFLASTATISIALLYEKIIDLIDFAINTFVSARADSSRVRAALGRIAVDRWEKEAPLFGHGIVEKGPHLVEYMMIGSHHTWYGLLYVKGAIGFIALLLALGLSFIEMLIRAQKNSLNKVGLSVTITILLYTFAENLEVLAYLYWPALIILGIAHKKDRDQLYQEPSNKTNN